MEEMKEKMEEMKEMMQEMMRRMPNPSASDNPGNISLSNYL